MWNFLASKNFQKILPDKTHKHTKSHLKKYFPNFRTQKNPGIENSNPKKSFDHPRHLKLGAPPLVPISSHLDWTSSINEGFIMWSKVDFLLWHQCGKNWGGRQAIRRKDSLIFCPLLDPAMMTKSPFSCLLPFFFFFLLLSNFAPHSTIWMLVFLQGVRLVSSKQTPMYCKVNFQYKNIASKRLIWLSRVHFRKKFNVYDPWWICLSSHSQLMPLLPMSLPHRFHWPIRPQIVSLCSKPTTWWVWTGVKYM